MDEILHLVDKKSSPPNIFQARSIRHILELFGTKDSGRMASYHINRNNLSDSLPNKMKRFFIKPSGKVEKNFVSLRIVQFKPLKIVLNKVAF